MKKVLFFGLTLLFLATLALFLYEGMSFRHYLAHQIKGEMNIPINNQAPVKSGSKIEIAAPVGKVWQVLTDINHWPSWQGDVTEAKLNGNLREGAEFKWKAGGLSFISQIHTMHPQTSFGWTGKTIGASAIHNWFFREEAGKTVVTVEESLQGVFPRLFRKYFQSNLDRGVQKNLSELKAAAEKE